MAGEADSPEPADRPFTALGRTIRTCNLPLSLFEDLLSAFRQDTTTTRYGSWDELLDYCRRSANPVGRLVLRIAGHQDAALDRASDQVCTALQLTNFWQDLERDWVRGRIRLEQGKLADLEGRRPDALAAYSEAIRLATAGNDPDIRHEAERLQRTPYR